MTAFPTMFFNLYRDSLEGISEGAGNLQLFGELPRQIVARRSLRQLEGAGAMNHRLWIAIATVAVAALSILAACGGGSSMSGTSSGSAMMPSAGASGVITGFGSVFVNGHEYATDASTQVLDGDDDAP